MDGYAERLSREAQQRERPADEEGEEAEGGAASIQDLLQQMMGGGGADGPVVKFEVVMGDGSEGGAGGGGGLSGLLDKVVLVATLVVVRSRPVGFEARLLHARRFELSPVVKDAHDVRLRDGDEQQWA